MYSYCNPTWQRIKRKVAEKTGLEKDDEIEVYTDFCHHADFNDGVIMFGDVQHEIYCHLENKSKSLKESERKFYQDYYNNSDRPDKIPKSPLSLEAEALYEKYLTIFIEKGLILPPAPVRKCSDKYPILKGYNYFNDPEFYRKTIKDNSTSFELVNPWEGIPCPDSPSIDDMLN
jgi:hypothetical protein